MSMRVVNVTEKNIAAVPPNVITVPAATATTILPVITQAASEEYAGRYIFNGCADNLYYAIGSDCDNVGNWHGYMAPGQQLDCSNHGQRVSCYSVAGGRVAVTLLRRQDFMRDKGIL